MIFRRSLQLWIWRPLLPVRGLPQFHRRGNGLGIPCVATDAGDRILRGDIGIVVNRGSSRKLSTGWDRARSPEDRQEMGRKARQRIIDDYCQDMTTRKYEDLYRDIIGATQKTAGQYQVHPDHPEIIRVITTPHSSATRIMGMSAEISAIFLPSSYSRPHPHLVIAPCVGNNAQNQAI